MAEAPHFFIVGAPKSGTTALFHYLSRHPGVFMPAIKETNYFCSDLKTHSAVRGHDEYMALFAAAPDGSTTGEASALYLYSAIAIDRIMAHNPCARIVAILRNPVDAAHALHNALWRYGHENARDFEQAWRMQEERLAGEHLPPDWPDPATLQYGRIFSYAAQIRHVLSLVPEGQRRVFVHEEFFADPARGFAELLEFLGVAPAGGQEFPVVNPAIGPASHVVDHVLRNPPRLLKALAAPLRPLFRAAGVGPKRLLWRLNSTPQRKAPLRPEFRAELERYFDADIAKLEGLLGRSFALWRRDPDKIGC